VYPKEADTLYLIDITRVIKYSPFLLTGRIWDVPGYLFGFEFLQVVSGAYDSNSFERAQL
jgi:hypothetical protein